MITMASKLQVLVVLCSMALVLLTGVGGSRSDWREESEEILERDRLLLEEWARMNNSVYAKADGVQAAKAPGETLHLFKSMLEVEGKFSAQMMARRQRIREGLEKMISKSYVSNLKCTNLFYHIELNYLIHENLNHTLNVLSYLNHCKLEQFATCRDFWAGKVRSIVEKMDEHDRRIVEDLVRTIRATLSEQQQQDAGHNLRMPMANIKQGLLTYVKHLQASDGLGFAEVRQAVRHATGLVKMKLDEMIDIYNQFVCDPDFARQMDQQTLDWTIAGNICRSISRMLEFLLNEKRDIDVFDESAASQQHKDKCWWFVE